MGDFQRITCGNTLPCAGMSSQASNDAIHAKFSWIIDYNIRFNCYLTIIIWKNVLIAKYLIEIVYREDKVVKDDEKDEDSGSL